MDSNIERPSLDSSATTDELVAVVTGGGTEQTNCAREIIVDAWHECHSGAISPVSAGSSRCSSRLSAPVAAVLESWRPTRLSPDEATAVVEVLPSVRCWVAAAAPSSPKLARDLLWATLRLAVWGYLSLGSTDPGIVLDPHNVEHWSNHFNKHRSERWRCAVRRLVRRVSRAVNPQAWSPRPLALTPPTVAKPYPRREEEVFVLDSSMPGRAHRAARMWVVCASFGAGMRGPEIRSAGPQDLVDLPNGRVGVDVAGRHSRLVPLRAEYTAMALQAADAVTGSKFITSEGQDPVQTIAKRIGPNGLGLRRARSTWLAAHLAANTPLAALQTVAGQLSVQTLGELIEEARAGLTPHQAAHQALGA